MSTARDIIKRSMKMIGALAAGETPSAEDAADGLEALNHMLKAWAISGIDIGAVTATLDSTLLVPDQYLDPIEYNLAVRLCPLFDATAPAEVVGLAKGYVNSLRAHTHEFDDDMAVDAALDPTYTKHRISTYDVDEG